MAVRLAATVASLVLAARLRGGSLPRIRERGPVLAASLTLPLLTPLPVGPRFLLHPGWS